MEEEIIPILRATDAASSVAWYGRSGFGRRWEHRFEPGLPAFVEVARGRVRLFLSEHEGDARPDTLVYLRVRDVDVIAAEFGVTVGETPWGREVELRDPDGNRLRVGAVGADADQSAVAVPAGRGVSSSVSSPEAFVAVPSAWSGAFASASGRGSGAVVTSSSGATSVSKPNTRA